MNNLPAPIFNKESYFYHQTIRRYTTVFGWIFSDFYIKRDDTFIKVPLIYGRGYAYEKVTQNAEEREKSRARMVLPAFSYELSTYEHDENRKQNRHVHLTHTVMNVDGTANSGLNRTPWNFVFTLTARTKNIDDMNQIVEQVLPVFNPSITLKIKDIDNTKMDVQQDITITLDSVDTEDTGEEDGETRIIETTFTFTLKGYLYHKIQEVNTINEVQITAVVEGEESIMGTYTDKDFLTATELNSRHYDVVSVDLPTSDDILNIQNNSKSYTKYNRKSKKNL